MQRAWEDEADLSFESISELLEKLLTEPLESPETPSAVDIEGVASSSLGPSLLEKGGSPESDSSSVPSPSPRRCVRHRRGISQKQQIADLRKTAATLTNVLAKLKRGVRSQSTASPSSSATLLAALRLIEQPMVAMKDPLWKTIAAQLLTLRQQTEQENVKLRLMVATQVRTAGNIKRMLKYRLDGGLFDGMPSFKRRKQSRGPTPTDNERVFDILLNSVDHIYVGVDQLLADKAIEQVSCPGRKRLVRRDAINGMFVEFLDKRQVPFSFQSVNTAVWKVLKGRRACDGQHVNAKLCEHETLQTDSTITSYVGMSYLVGDIVGYLQERRVARKYVEESRTLFVSRVLTEPTSGQLGSLGLCFQETLTIVVRQGDALFSGQETTLIESHLIVTRHDEGNELSTRFRGAAYVDLAVRGWDSKLPFNCQEIENLLFDEAIATAN